MALAEALGRFGQGGVLSAFYWTYPVKWFAAFWAFRAFRNFDGAGGRFLNLSLRGRRQRRLAASPRARRERDAHRRGGPEPEAGIARSGRSFACPAAPRSARQRALRYAGGRDGFTAAVAAIEGGAITTEALPPSSITRISISTSR